MDIIQKFGNAVSSMSLEDPREGAQASSYRIPTSGETTALFSDKKLPKSGQYVARIVMKNIIQTLSKPENSAMVSIFVPGELLTAAGLTPYSVEAMSCFIAGTRCEQTFFEKNRRRGISGNDVLLSQSFPWSDTIRTCAKAKMYDLHKSSM